MGINKETLDLLHAHMKSPGVMVELGNQEFDVEVLQAYSIKSRIAKQYFSSLGWQHTSIDINGKDGAVRLNLNKILPYHYDADIVTNFGTSEHVPNQYNCFKNIHNFTKVKGLMIHALPKVGHWPGHCKYYYTEDFMHYLAKVNAYELLDLRIIPNPDHLIFAVLKKCSDAPFCPDETNFVNQIQITKKIDPQSYYGD